MSALVENFQLKDLEEQQRLNAIAERKRVLIHAREDLLSFTQLMMPHQEDVDDVKRSRYSPQKHHRAIAAALEAVERGEIRRLIITMPPGAGKSELCAKKFIPWLVGRDPYRNVIFASYSADFAEDTGRAVRDTMREALYKQVFPFCKLRQGSASAKRIQTEEGGIIVSAGADGPITGRRAHFFIIDDPVKGIEQADSPTEREHVWKWFVANCMSRRDSFTSSVIIITTRWHDDDIVGRITDPNNPCYNEEECGMWKILELPSMAERDEPPPMSRKKGEALWPDKFPVEMLESIKRMDARLFSALYQCRPSPEDGDFFKREYIRYYKPEELPKNLRFYAASDHAVSEKQRADKTCLMTVGIDEDDNIYVLPELFWDKADTEKVVEAMIRMIKLRKPCFWWAESGHITKSIGPFLKKRMKDERAYCAIIETSPAKDKKTRAQSIQARMSMGKVFFPKFASWTQEAVTELLKFPAGRHDDFVDTLAWIGIGLNLQGSASPYSNREESQPKYGTLAWLKMNRKMEERNNRRNDGF